MAQTRRKRQTKHRGNAMGVVESRGRTGRKPTAAEKDPSSRAAKLEASKKIDKRDLPPTWRSAFVRAMFAAVVLLLVMLLVLKQSNQAIALFPIVLLLYVPIGYYTEKWMYDRRQRNKARAIAAGKRGAR